MGLLRDGDHVPCEGGGGHAEGQRHGPHQGITYLVLLYDGGPAKFIPRFYAVLIGTQSL